MNKHPELIGFALSALIVICATVLIALHVPTPSWFETLATIGAAGSVGAVMAPTVASASTWGAGSSSTPPHG